MLGPIIGRRKPKRRRFLRRVAAAHVGSGEGLESVCIRVWRARLAVGSATLAGLSFQPLPAPLRVWPTPWHSSGGSRHQ